MRSPSVCLDLYKRTGRCVEGAFVELKLSREMQKFRIAGELANVRTKICACASGMIRTFQALIH